ncbi:MAG TPA: TonB-dependent receptor [Candidatus Acidoferrales bacterium]|nr:TonB-dependent receptor [Candidatus Acidoferrales bacterium]
MTHKIGRSIFLLLILSACLPLATKAQQTLGSINGTVTDPSNAVVLKAAVQVKNLATGLTVDATTQNDGSYNVANLPIGTYSVTISKQGFKTEVHSDILVRGNLTTTVNATLQPGEVSSTVTVTGTPLMNQTDTTNGYTLGTEVIENTPLGTGSFTQLAILAPGVNADLLSGSGTNAGLGNQEIWANGQRDTSNSFSFNSVNANNLFNGKSSSSVSESRFVLNTNENFLPGGQIQTNASVYDAIGQGLPTPPPETIEELHVNTSMYDASQGANSGAHIELTTKSGTNDLHGQAYEYHQTAGWNANNFFLNAAGIARPSLHRNTFGGLIGGPIVRNKLFFFGSYQGQRVTDGFNGSTDVVTVPDGLTNQRDQATLEALAGVAPGSSDKVALAILQAKTASGQFIVPSQNIFGAQIGVLGGNALEQGAPSTFRADQLNGNVDYDLSPKDRLSGKYYYQRNPSTSPFAVSQTLGFPQNLSAGSQVLSLDNTTSLTPNTSWEQRIGFIREVAFANTGQVLTPGGTGLNLFGSTFFPGFTIANIEGGANSNGNDLRIGPANNFANAGVFQNQFEGASNYNWIAGRHSLSFGVTFDYGQLNIVNRENQVATFNFAATRGGNSSFGNFLTGTLDGSRNSGRLLDGETNRYYRSKQLGLYAQDDFKLKPNLTVDLGLRWDWDGPLSEKNGLLTNFYPQNYSYDLGTDTINNIGLVIAGNNKQFCGTKSSLCVSDSTLTGRQWGLAPRLGVAWSPSALKNVVVRAGFGLYFDRGEFFSELSPSAGLGISGPFGVTTEEPFTVPVTTSCTGPGCLTGSPFGATAPPPPPSNLTGVAALIHNQSELSGCAEPVTPTCTPTGFANFAFLFGGYDPKNTLPYSENWSLDLQWQPYNSLVTTISYTGNHGLHEVLPIPFNEPAIATPTNPVNGQTATYGMEAADSSAACPTENKANFFTPCPLQAEQVQTSIGEFAFSDGNTALRVPFIGYNPNSDFNKAEGISHYNALALSVNKRMSHGLQVNASYTWSHSLDEGSGLQLFYNGNDPLNPRSAYGNSGYDRTHVFVLSYVYQIPTVARFTGIRDAVVNGWGIGGITVLESGQPFSVTDFSGSVGNIFFSADDFITNPILPIASGKTVSQVQLQSTHGVNPANPYFDATAFTIPLLNPGQSGVPQCGPAVNPNTGAPDGQTVCDNLETGFGNTGRNIFRGPFQSRFDFSVFKNFKLTERFHLRYDAQFFNLFNHPSFDAPSNNVSLNNCFSPMPCYQNPPASSQGIGLIQGTLGSPRFIQMALHLTF